MAAKEHTNNLANANAAEYRKSLQSDKDTYGQSSNKEGGAISSTNSVKEENVFKAGTFAAEPALINVEQVDSVVYGDGVAERDRNTH